MLPEVQGRPGGGGASLPGAGAAQSTCRPPAEVSDAAPGQPGVPSGSREQPARPHRPRSTHPTSQHVRKGNECSRACLPFYGPVLAPDDSHLPFQVRGHQLSRIRVQARTAYLPGALGLSSRRTRSRAVGGTDLGTRSPVLGAVVLVGPGSRGGSGGRSGTRCGPRSAWNPARDTGHGAGGPQTPSGSCFPPAGSRGQRLRTATFSSSKHGGSSEAGS